MFGLRVELWRFKSTAAQFYSCILAEVVSVMVHARELRSRLSARSRPTLVCCVL